MSYNKAVKTAVTCILSVWLICAVILFITDKNRTELEVSMQDELNSIVARNNATTTTEITTLFDVTTTTGTTLGSDGNLVATTAGATDPDWYVDQQESVAASEAATTTAVAVNVTTTQAGLSVPSTTSEIIAAYTSAVNALKSEQNFSLVKTDTLNISIDDMPGGSTFTGIADSMVASNSPSDPYYYTFASGYDSSGATPTSVIAPLNTSASLSESGVLSASATATSSGGYTIKIALVDETQTLTSPATNHATTVQIIDVDSLGLPSGTDVTTLDINYSDATIEAEINSDGKIVSIYHVLPVDYASADGEYLLFSIHVELHGEYTSKYEITYT